MRRSRSLSNIPVPTHLKRDSKTRERSKSALRNSRDRSGDFHTPLAFRTGMAFGTNERKRVLEKKYSSTSMTPSFSTRGSRFGGTNLLTPRTSITVNRSPAGPSLHKLANDKKWVAEQFSKIQQFVQNSGLFRPEIVGMLRPPTINTFVEVMSILLNNLFPKVLITNQNYAEIVQAKLKVLKYPGAITMSSIKSANTMHGWPQFITMVSWLVDRVNLSNFTQNYNDEETEKTYAYQNCLLEYINIRYIIFSNSEGEESIKEAEREFCNKLANLTETDLDEVEKIRHHFETFRAEIADIENKIEEISADNAKNQQSIAEKKTIIQGFEENKTSREQNIEDELQQLLRHVPKQKEKRDNLALTITQLQNLIASQTFTVKKKEETLKTIAELERDISRKKNMLEELRFIKDDLDRELTAKVLETETKVDKWNVAVTKTFLPELQHLQLREKGFHCTEFLEEIKEKNGVWKELDKQLSKECKNITTDLDTIEKEKISLNERFNVLCDTKKSLDDIDIILQADIEKTRCMIAQVLDVKKNQDLQIIQLEECLSKKVRDKEVNMKELDEKIRNSTEAFNRMSEKGLGLLVEANNITMRHFSRIDEKMQFLLNELGNTSAEATNNLLVSYRQLAEAKEFTDSLMNNFNVDS